MKISTYEVSQVAGIKEWANDLAVVGLGANTYVIGLVDRFPGRDDFCAGGVVLRGVLRLVMEQLPMLSPQGQLGGISNIQAMAPLLYGRPIHQMYVKEWTAYFGGDDLDADVRDRCWRRSGGGAPDLSRGEG